MNENSPPQSVKELLVASVTPQNLERGVLWFQENLAAIKKARHTNPWWREESMVLEKDLVLKPSLLIRQLVSWGYERTQTVRGRGLFAVRGGIIEVWPINSDRPWLIEFNGNTIAELIQTPRLPAPSLEAKHLYRGLASIEKRSLGSYVVHVDHGIGIFGGVHPQKPEFFIVEYAPPAKGRQPDLLLVPIDQKDRLTPYIGFTTPTIHRLGGTIWERTKKKIKEETEKLAQELLALYAKRNLARRAPHQGDILLEESVAASFPYQETEDQTRAYKEICDDLLRDAPMDRVLCGDVGFGKTEVAIRAALRVIASGKQVAVLAPTTVLAAQHERTFCDRLAPLPITVTMLSRLTPQKDGKQILKELADGKIDCVIGTHRLFSHDIRFRDLGLVVIDEEQRFGVKQKERFKELRAEVDILSLSATPIPRTLSLALAKLRDISRIETAPAGRVPIATAVLPHGNKLIREAILYELARGGQIYFLHNRIETIDAAKERLEKLLSSLSFSYDRRKIIVPPRRSPPRIGMIHGRMKEKELIAVMGRFRNKEIDVLIATTIIENGLDISSANTLIVDDATRLGLAEAHQLRGRIGRGSKQAFAYFLYRPRNLTPRATERLEALKAYTAPGDGYEIALRDLELRGAGNILGREQSGAINKVGLNLYYQMLAEAVETYKEIPSAQ